MDTGVILGIMAVLILSASIIGIVAYKKILTKFSGIISLGNVLATVFGTAALIMALGGIVSAFSGEPRLVETIFALLISAVCIFFVVKAIKKCPTVMEKILFPFSCWCLALGFGFRFALSFFIDIGVSMGENEEQSGFPSGFVGDDGRYYSLVADYGHSAEYNVEGSIISVKKAELRQIMRYASDD